jgi:hypothetical protein
MDTYEYDADKSCQEIFEQGFSYLPSIKNLIDQNNILEDALEEIGSETYSTDNAAHLKLVELMNLEPLFENVFHKAVKDLKVNLEKSDRYFVARKVNPGQSSEKYRAHFDSHLLTIVLPISIPIARDGLIERGELKAAPNARTFPKYEIINIFQKAYWKKYASEEGFSIVSKKTRVLTEYFDDYRPLAFFGTTTLHGNNYVSENAESRLTFLCHLYDPSPKYGIGALLRKIRAR